MVKVINKWVRMQGDVCKSKKLLERLEYMKLMESEENCREINSDLEYLVRRMFLAIVHIEMGEGLDVLVGA